MLAVTRPVRAATADGRARLLQPGHYVERAAPAIRHGTGAGGEWHQHRRPHPLRGGQGAAVAVAAVQQHQIAGLQLEVLQALAGMAIGQLDLTNAPGDQVKRQVQPPGIAGLPGLANH
ncbi:MAG: hypothetical protein ABIN37_13510 [Burkholderiaceae bacterium]